MQPMPQIVPLYAACLAAVFFVLSVRTIVLRARHRVAIGDGEVPRLRRAMRAHANFAEYAPFCVLLFAFVEAGGAPAWIVHALCGAFVLGRCIHGVTLSREPEPPLLRQVAMALTFTPLLGSGAAIVQQALAA